MCKRNNSNLVNPPFTYKVAEFLHNSDLDDPQFARERKDLVFSETKAQKKCIKLSVSQLVQLPRQVNQ